VLRNRDRRRVGEWLKAERLRAGLNQEQLARAMKMGGQANISNIEVGQRRFDVLEFIELAAALGTTPMKLMSRLTASLKEAE
jgi:transcriptional regulator with XRE-family HTH domain